jgi:predicted TIM-barrel enzyme
MDLGQAARDAWDRGLADGLITSGLATGAATDPARIRAVKEAVPAAPVWIGSGLTPENAVELLSLADGAIVGTTLMQDGVAGNGVDPERIRIFLEAAAPARG